jgi:hypothetical protein
LAVDPAGILLGAIAVPNKAANVRYGYSFLKKADAVNCISLTGWPPTTVAATSFHNLNTERSVVVDRITWTQTTASDAAGSILMVACLSQTAVTSQPATADTATGIVSLNCGVTNAGTASKVVSSHDVSIVDNGWFAVGSSGQDATATDIAKSIDCKINGLIILPPGHLLSFKLADGTDTNIVDPYKTTTAGAITLFWHEMTL